jgi:hypothetical protein
MCVDAEDMNGSSFGGGVIDLPRELLAEAEGYARSLRTRKRPTARPNAVSTQALLDGCVL